MTINVDLLKFYPSSDGNGGTIVTTHPIVNATLNNIFDDVTDVERDAGHIDYRKIFFRNENVDSFTYPKVYISANTLCTSDTVFIALGTPTGDLGEAYGLTFTAPNSIASALPASTLTTNSSFSIWIKRVVDAASFGYNNNAFSLTVEQATS